MRWQPGTIAQLGNPWWDVAQVVQGRESPTCHLASWGPNAQPTGHGDGHRCPSRFRFLNTSQQLPCLLTMRQMLALNSRRTRGSR